MNHITKHSPCGATPSNNKEQRADKNKKNYGKSGKQEKILRNFYLIKKIEQKAFEIKKKADIGGYGVLSIG